MGARLICGVGGRAGWQATASLEAAERALGLAADLPITLLSSSVFPSGLWPTDIDHAGPEGGDGLCFLLFCSLASLIVSPWKQAQPLCSPCFGPIDANWGFFFALHLPWDQRERWGRGKRTSSSLELLEWGLLPQGRWGQTPAWSDLCGGAVSHEVPGGACALWFMDTQHPHLGSPPPAPTHRGGCWPLGTGGWWESHPCWQELGVRPSTFPGRGFSPEGGEVLSPFGPGTP